MTLHIELNGDLEARVAAAAGARGVATEQYVKELIREAVSSSPISGPRAESSRLEFRSFLDALESKKPIADELKSEPFSRGFLYRDHD